MTLEGVFAFHLQVSGGGDDAIALKSDFSLGEELESYNITVRNSSIGSDGCNALQFGSETVQRRVSVRVRMYEAFGPRAHYLHVHCSGRSIL